MLNLSHVDRCPNLPVVWANISFELDYNIGSQLYKCTCSPKQSQAEGFKISNCTNSDDWNPNPFNTICTYEGIIQSFSNIAS